jgi:hypothetical protein
MPGTSTACGACINELERALGDIAFYAAHLEVTFSRQARIGSGDGGRRSAELPLPYDSRASRAASVLRNTLVGWVRVMLETVGEPVHGPVCVACKHPSCRRAKMTRTPGDTLGQMAAWLLLHIDRIRQHEAGGEIAGTITLAVTAAEQAVDRPEGRVYSGPCDECGKDLYGKLDAAVITCHGCGLEYDIAARREWLLVEAREVVANAALISRALGRLGVEVKVDRIYQWVGRRQLVPVGLDANRRSLYRFGDVLDLLERMDAKPERIGA